MPEVVKAEVFAPALAIHATRVSVAGFDTSRAGRADARPFLALTSGAPAQSSRKDKCPDGAAITLLERHPKQRTLVSSLHANTDGHVSRFIASSGASSSLGTATTIKGGWQAAGKASKSMGLETGWGRRKKAGNWGMVTFYEMGTYEVSASEAGICTRWKKFKPIVHEGGTASRKVPVQQAGYCRPYQRDSKYKVHKSKAVSYEVGLGVKSIIGFNLSSTSGFSSDELIRVKITKKKRQICGIDKVPAQHPRRVVIKHVNDSTRMPCARKPCVRGGM